MNLSPAISIWRDSLKGLLLRYQKDRGPLWRFLPLLFLFFVAINIGCYWWAMVTVFPDYLIGPSADHYFKVQFPVGILGALFDTLSFFITIRLIKRALQSTTNARYLGHLSIDLLIAIIASCWVVFVFSFSGMLVSFLEPDPAALAAPDLVAEAIAAKKSPREVLANRNKVYTARVVSALKNPLENWRNIYFGIVMGVSAMIPTCVHLWMCLKSFIVSYRRPSQA